MRPAKSACLLGVCCGVAAPEAALATVGCKGRSVWRQIAPLAATTNAVCVLSRPNSRPVKFNDTYLSSDVH